MSAESQRFTAAHEGCCVCHATGPMKKAKDWRGWSQTGVEFIPPNKYREAAYCPTCAELRQRLSIFCAKGSWGLGALRERFNLGGGIFGKPRRQPRKKARRTAK